MKTKQLRFTAFFLAFALFAVSVAGICVSFALTVTAAYNASSLFASSTRSEVVAEANEYMRFSFEGTTNNAVSYNRNLAYKWFTMEDGANDPEGNYFSLEFSFDNATFDTFTVTFQSAENSKSIDGVTENQIVFFNDNGSYSVAIRNDDQADVADEDLTKTDLTLSSLAGATVRIDFTESDVSGEYGVNITIGDQTIPGTFTNIRGAYAQYTASELVPLSFAAELPEEDSEATVLSLISLNGQNFLLDENAQVVDDTPPVLVIDDDIKGFTLGTSILNSFSYATVDVCDATVSRTVTYYQYNPADEAPSYETLTSSVKIFDKYMYESEGAEYISVCFSLNDDDDNAATYYVSWYADDRDEDVKTFDDVGYDDVEYLYVSRDTEAPVYTCIDTAGTDQTLNEEHEAYTTYVDDVARAAEGLRAGEGYYFYLPSLEDMIEDNDTTYTGLTFTIYYKSDGSDSTSTLSNLSYDELEIPVSSTGGYRFKVVASDKSGNAMVFYRNGLRVTVDSDNIWDIDAIPAFDFYVENRGLEIEEIEALSYAYVYSNYTVQDFEVKGVSGYESKYTLYYLEGVSSSDISYAEMIDFANKCYDDGVSDAEFVSLFEEEFECTGVSLREIDEWDSNGPEDEDDDGWDTHDNRYGWSVSSLSFTPQEAGYYIVYGEFVDSELWSDHLYAYQIVYSSSEVDESYGATYWIENNVVTVVFIVIAVISAIGLLVVWIVFPSKEPAADAVRSGRGASGKFAEKRKKGGKDKKTDESND